VLLLVQKKFSYFLNQILQVISSPPVPRDFSDFDALLVAWLLGKLGEDFERGQNFGGAPLACVRRSLVKYVRYRT
jgi:hypothetical protein